jgi:poly(hydroxyalkanoate) granule-associated protein
MPRKKSARNKGTARKARSKVQTQSLDSMNQIWLAGLGAVSKAQRGAPQLLQELIAEGARVHAKTRGAAEKAVRGMVSDVRSTINSRIGEVRGQAADALEGLEKIFQSRVHRALTQIGVPSAEDIAALSERVEALSANIEKLAQSRKGVDGRRHSAAHKAPAAPPVA